MDFMIGLRIIHAFKLLADETKSVDSVCYKCGF